MFLPAALYLLFWLLASRGHRRPRAEAGDSVLRPGRADLEPLPPSLPPPALSRLREVFESRAQPVPTLVIGLGGSGRHVLTHLKALVAETFIAPDDTGLAFLQLDAAASEYVGPEARDVAVAGLSLSVETGEVVLLPEHSRKLHAVLAADTQPPWLDAEVYRGRPSGQLDLTRGSHGDRTLARLGLWQDLKRHSGKADAAESAAGRPTIRSATMRAQQGAHSTVATAIEQAVAQLLEQPAADELRQVFLVTSCEGGVGSGWYHDVASIVRSAVRRAQVGRPDRAPPRRYGLLLSVEGAAAGAGSDIRERLIANRNGLLRERNRLALAGQYPFRDSNQGAAALDEQLVDATFFLSRHGDPCTHAYPEAADVVGVFLQQDTRRRISPLLEGPLLQDARNLAVDGDARFSLVGCQSVIFPVRHLSERLYWRFLQHLIHSLFWRDNGQESDVDGRGCVVEPTATRQGQICRILDKPGLGVTAPVVSGDLVRVAQAGPTALRAYMAGHFGAMLRQRELTLAELYWATRAGLQRLRSSVAGTMSRGGSTGRRTGSSHDRPSDQSSERIRAAIAAQFDAWVEEFERWIAVLVGSGAIADPVFPKAMSNQSGLLAQAAARHAETADQEAALATIECRHYLADGEGDPALSEENAYRRWLGRWLDSDDCKSELARRFWLDARSDGQLELAFAGERVERYTRADRRELEESIRRLSSQWLDALRQISIYRKLSGQGSPYPVEPGAVAETLSRPPVAGAGAEAESQQTNVLVVPPVELSALAPDPDYRPALIESVRGGLKMWEQLSVVEARDHRVVRLVSVLPGRRLGDLSKLLSGSDAGVLEGPWQPVESAECYLQRLVLELERRTAMTIAAIDPGLAVVTSAPARLREFARLWIAGQVTSTPSGPTWLRLPDGSTAKLSHSDSLFDAAARFVTHFSEIKAGQIATGDSLSSEPEPSRVARLRATRDAFCKDGVTPAHDQLSRRPATSPRMNSDREWQVELLLTLYCQSIW
ncbi:MAG: hypothetical protein MJE77_08950 [Proteobacteria bacterium]|nr:hypothetical protein [Pseudomonadota bacterium]